MVFTNVLLERAPALIGVSPSGCLHVFFSANKLSLHNSIVRSVARQAFHLHTMHSPVGHSAQRSATHNLAVVNNGRTGSYLIHV